MRRLALAGTAAVAIGALTIALVAALLRSDGHTAAPTPGATSTVRAPRPPARTVTAHPYRTPGPPSPNPGQPVPVVGTTTTRVEHPPMVTVTRTQVHNSSKPTVTRTVTRPVPRPSTSSRPNPIRSVICGLHLCRTETP